MKKEWNDEKIKLSGFNNLTKALSFNLYDFCVGRNEREQKAYVKYIAEKYNANAITKLLKGICGIIEAEVLAVSDQDYDPWGASSMVLMGDLKGGGVADLNVSKAMHLDKSHVCAHTYPDFSMESGICSFRVDIDIATCGEISPLSALNYMFANFDSDVVVMDYVVRGFTRDQQGKRIYRDHDLTSIQDFVDPEVLSDYHCIDLCLQSDNIWQTKMLRMNMDEQEYFLDQTDVGLSENREMLDRIKKEMRGILNMWPD
ncbi:adenosylmethionine decarboxylase [Oligoflexaceae bacterium]|nr:adenosylmethionine decarboxylase [Oligoflexaceae bacterium]